MTTKSLKHIEEIFPENDLEVSLETPLYLEGKIDKRGKFERNLSIKERRGKWGRYYSKIRKKLKEWEEEIKEYEERAKEEIFGPAPRDLLGSLCDEYYSKFLKFLESQKVILKVGLKVGKKEIETNCRSIFNELTLKETYELVENFIEKYPEDKWIIGFNPKRFFGRDYERALKENLYGRVY